MFQKSSLRQRFLLMLRRQRPLIRKDRVSPTPHGSSPAGALSLASVSSSLDKNAPWLQKTLIEILPEFSPLAIAMFDKNMCYLMANKAWTVGYKLDFTEFFGKCHYDLFPNMPQHWRAVHERCLAGAVEYSAGDRAILPDGTEVWTQWEVRPWRHTDGTIGGILIWSHNVTAQVRAEAALTQSRESMRLAVEAARIGTWNLDLVSGDLEWSPRCYEIHGLPSSQKLTYESFMTRLVPEHRELTSQKVRRAIAGECGGYYQVEYQTVPLDNGEQRWVTVNGQVYFDTHGVPTRMTGTALDITDKKRQEEALRLAKEAAEAANQAKSAFLANMSHELRTPLGAILGFSELMVGKDLNACDLTNYKNIIKRNGELLTNIINDILDLSKVEAGKLDIDRKMVLLSDTLTDVQQLLTLQAQEKGIQLHIRQDDSVPEWIGTDALRLRQILVNIVGNAIKFTDRGRVEVAIACVALQDGRTCLRFTVKDTGRGISKEQAAKLFQPFTQGDETTRRRYGGTGLGLALSKRLAQLLGGDVELVTSEVGQGSEFAITVDVTSPCPNLDGASAAARTATKSAHDAQFDLRGMRILVTDDVPDNQLLLSRILKLAGAEVDVANNGAEAVAKACVSDFDLLLMDLQMPTMDGFEATNALRRSGFSKPIIALTAFAFEEERQRCLDRGFDDHIAKPIDRHRLLEKVAEHRHRVH